MKTFTYTWRNKFLCIDATSFEEFIEILESAVTELKDWQEKGVIFTGDGVGDDYAHFITHDPKLADELGFEEDWWDEDDDERF